MSITADTRLESYEKINKETMYNLIVNTLKEYKNSGLTAREIAIELYNKGLVKSNDRQATAPRLTELVDKGIVVVIGKKMDEFTQRNVAVYTLYN